MKYDLVLLIVGGVYFILAITWYIALFVPTGDGSSSIFVPPTAQPQPPMAPTAPGNDTTPTAPPQINGGITIAILFFFIGLGAPGLGVLGWFVLLMAYHENHPQILTCVCKFIIFAFINPNLFPSFLFSVGRAWPLRCFSCGSSPPLPTFSS